MPWNRFCKTLHAFMTYFILVLFTFCPWSQSIKSFDRKNFEPFVVLLSQTDSWTQINKNKEMINCIDILYGNIFSKRQKDCLRKQSEDDINRSKLRRSTQKDKKIEYDIKIDMNWSPITHILIKIIFDLLSQNFVIFLLNLLSTYLHLPKTKSSSKLLFDSVMKFYDLRLTDSSLPSSRLKFLLVDFNKWRYAYYDTSQAML